MRPAAGSAAQAQQRREQRADRRHGEGLQAAEEGLFEEVRAGVGREERTDEAAHAGGGLAREQGAEIDVQPGETGTDRQQHRAAGQQAGQAEVGRPARLQFSAPEFMPGPCAARR
jgi:hypothetical protein